MKRKFKLLASWQHSGRPLFVMCLLIMFVVNLSFSQVADQAQQVDPVTAFIKSNPDDKLVKFHLNYPLDQNAYRALKLKTVLSNKEQHPELDAKSIQQMEKELTACMTSVNAISKFMEKGDTYEVARNKSDRELQRKESENARTTGNKPVDSEPTPSTPSIQAVPNN